jgi:hypothetical protein
MRRAGRVLAAAALVASSASVWWLLAPREGIEVERFRSPDGRYAVVLTADPRPRPFALPGQGSDRPGAVTLVAADGRRLWTAPVELVSAIGATSVRFHADSVSVVGVVDWPLPDR